MENRNVIRKNPLFEILIENNHIVVNNADYSKDNCVINLNDILSIDVIRHLRFFDKFLMVFFGFYGEAKSNELRINLRNGFKNIILTECDIKKVELIVYEVNRLIIKKADNTNPI